MRLYLPIAAVSILSVVASTFAESLDQYFTTAVLGDRHSQGLFPNRSGWETAFKKTFTKNTKFSIGTAAVDFDGLFQIYTDGEAQLKATFSSYTLDFTSLVTIPNPNDLGGLVFVTGFETGRFRANGTTKRVTDGNFAVVSEISGKRRVTEWREGSNV